jgi:Protein kinase domain/PASTA domain
VPRAPDLSGLALDGRYELHAVIGEGTFGRVYRGRDRRLARWVAVKVIKPWWAEDPEWTGNFEREAQLLASISDPGIIQIYDVGAAAEGLYYVAELVDGESLASRLRSGRLASAEACEIALQLALALARAHAQRVVHRDVKPANVLITRDGRVKVGDFGVARLAEGSSDGAVATIAGTPGYMAPEQASGEPTSPATDVYGVGIVLYEMLAGHPPFEGKSTVELALRHVNDPPPPLPADTPQTVARIVTRALAKDPAERYPDGHELAAALGRARIRAAEDEDGEVAGVGSSSRRAAVALVGAAAEPSTVTEVIRRTGSAEAGAHRSVERGALAEAEAGAHRSVERGALGEAEAGAPPHRDNGDAAGGPPPIPPTRVGDPRSPRHNFNPSERRQRVALLSFAVLIAAGMGAVALAIAPGHLTVPNLLGMSKGRIERTAHRQDFHAAFSRRYSAKPRGDAIAQSPQAGTRVDDGATVSVVLSAGPRPVKVPDVVGSSTENAQTVLRRLRLRAAVTQVPAPGVSTGTITGQSPAAGASLAPRSTVALSAAEAPRLRPLTSFSENGNGRSVPFRIRGSRWEIVYSMGYEGTCTFIFFCSGPSANVTNVRNGSTVDQFDLGEGSGENRIFESGPGVYQIAVSPGSDSARWKIQVDDYY